jgi:hypothetical protein
MRQAVCEYRDHIISQFKKYLLQLTTTTGLDQNNWISIICIVRTKYKDSFDEKYDLVCSSSKARGEACHTYF